MLALRNGLIAGLLFSVCLLGLQVSFLLSRGCRLTRGSALEDAVLNYSSATLSGARDDNNGMIGDLWDGRLPRPPPHSLTPWQAILGKNPGRVDRLSLPPFTDRPLKLWVVLLLLAGPLDHESPFFL